MLRRGVVLLARQRCGIVGLPNVGKSTFFNALTGQAGETGNQPFVTIKPNTGQAVVRDKRLDQIAALPPHRKAKILRNSVDVWDIAGLVRGAGKGEGLGNQFLSNIRECQAILHMVRCYDDDAVVHMEGGVDPLRDIAVINNELMVADLQSLQKQGDKSKNPAVKAAMEMCQERLLSGDMLFKLKGEIDPEQWAIVERANLISAKEMLYVCNVDEDSASKGGNEYVDRVRTEHGARHRVCVVSASIEEEATRMSAEEGQELLEGFGIDHSMVPDVTLAVLEAVHQITYFTAGPIEVRGWTCARGATAREASGAIHSDFPDRLLKADVTPFQTYIDSNGADSAAKPQQVSYLVQDGDVLYFHIDQSKGKGKR